MASTSEEQTMTTNHKHRVIKSTCDLPFFGCVSDKCNEGAHGDRRVRRTCACGAEQEVNVNGKHAELGPWSTGNAEGTL